MSAKASRRLRNTLIVVLAFAALYAAYRYTLHRMVESKLNEIRKQGYPATLAELDKWYPQPPPGENAKSVYLEAFDKNTRLREEERRLPIVGWSNLPLRGVALPQSMADGIARYLETNQESLVLLHEATAMLHCRFTTNLSVTVIQHSQDSGLRQAARKLELEAIYDATSGNKELTAKALLASIGLVRHFSDEPLAIPRLVQQACFGLTQQAIEHALSSVQLDSNQLGSVSSSLVAADESLDARRILVSELAWDDDVFSEMRRDYRNAISMTVDFINTNPPPAWRRFLLAVGYRPLGILDFDQLTCLRIELTALRISESELPQRIPELSNLTSETNQISTLLPMSRQIAWFDCQFLKLDARFMAALRVTRAGLAVESYRTEHGQLPDAIPSTLIDPFDGQPLRYKKLAKGYVVYSVGEDGKDDGGDEKKDITFTVER